MTCRENYFATSSSVPPSTFQRTREVRLSGNETEKPDPLSFVLSARLLYVCLVIDADAVCKLSSHALSQVAGCRDDSTEQTICRYPESQVAILYLLCLSI